MPQLVTNTAQISCSFGTTPSALVVTPEARVTAVNKPAATIIDHVPMKNIMPFGMCTTLSNPQVAAATAAAQGVLTPQPCIPVTNAPWIPGSPTVQVANKPALNNTCTCLCTWGGVVSVVNAGQQTVQVP